MTAVELWKHFLFISRKLADAKRTFKRAIETAEKNKIGFQMEGDSEGAASMDAAIKNMKTEWEKDLKAFKQKKGKRK